MGLPREIQLLLASFADKHVKGDCNQGGGNSTSIPLSLLYLSFGIQERE